MPDNRKQLRERLGKLGLGLYREEEIVRELSDHLEDQAGALQALGMTNDEGFQKALSGEVDWPKFREEIYRAETEEATMNYQLTYRAKILWLPALGALTLSSSLLALFQFSGLVPRFHWLSSGMSGGSYYTFYIPWLIAMPVVGAISALWSQRAGGKTIHRLLAALAPPIGMLGTFLILPFITLLIYTLIRLFSSRGLHTPFPIHAAPMMTGIFVLVVSWVLLPAAGLLLGAVPFLRKPQSQS